MIFKGTDFYWKGWTYSKATQFAKDNDWTEKMVYVHLP